MKKIFLHRRSKILVGLALFVIVAVCVSFALRSPENLITVTGPLSEEDVQEIKRVIRTERPPILRKGSSVEETTLRIRECIFGELTSIQTRTNESKYAEVKIRDRIDSRITYEYDMKRTTNGWKMVAFLSG